MRKLVMICMLAPVCGLVFTSCKVKQNTNDLSSKEKTSSLLSELLQDDDLVEQLAKTWTVATVNYQADARKDVLYQQGENTNLRDFSKESLQLSKDGKLVYTDDGGDKHHGTWKLTDHQTKLKMVLNDGQTVYWDVLKSAQNSLVLHLSVNARSVNWDVQKVDDIDIPTAAVFAGFFAGIVDENTQQISITYKMTPKS